MRAGKKTYSRLQSGIFFIENKKSTNTNYSEDKKFPNEINQSDVHSSPDSHPEEEVLELYVMGRLNRPDIDTIRDHIEQCEHCQYRAMDLGEFINTLRDAAHEGKAEQKYRLTVNEQQPSRFPRRYVWMTAAAAAAGVIIAIPLIQPQNHPIETIRIASLRGDVMPEGSAIAPANKSFDLLVDLTGISEQNCCLVEIVDAHGQSVFKVSATNLNHQTTVRSKPLQSGTYWVRVFTHDDTPLREMGLIAR